MPSYSQEDILNALNLFDQEKNVTRVVRKLGYPTTATLYLWLRQRQPRSNSGLASLSYEGERINRSSYLERKEVSPDMKLIALRRCFQDGEDVRLVAEEFGVSRQSIHKWRRKVESHGVISLMNKSKKKIHDPAILDQVNRVTQDTDEIIKLKRELKALRIELDILKEAMNLLKKDKGIGFLRIRNKEKFMIINALKERYQLNELLPIINIARSSYHYHLNRSKCESKYKRIRLKIKEIYENNHSVYGYRRIKISLENQGLKVSEKVIQRLMKEMELTPKYTKKRRKYSSYQGEISEAPRNILNRDFSSEYPNQKWLTDITEFALANEKVYLSSLVDCFDGKIVSWNTSITPDSQLANQSLINACKTLKKEDRVIIHSDRGAHYRWSEWIHITQKNNLIRSMSKKGCTGDNAACEGVFGRIKNECFYGKDFKEYDSQEFIQYLDGYLTWYNENRIKLKFGCSINENRRKLAY